LFFLPFNGLHQLELRATAVQVVPFAMHFEIRVPAQVIGEETDADLESNQLA
jgi:hypothetical protein